MNSVKKKAIFSTALILVIAAIIFIATACDIYFYYYDYSGVAVNVKSEGDSTTYWKDGDYTLAGASAKLFAYNSDNGTFSSTADYTAEVSSSGSFTFSQIPTGKYLLTGSDSSSYWTFVPRFIEISGDGGALPDLFAYPAADAGVFTIITSWENAAIDVDSILTYGESDGSTTDDWTDALKNPATGHRTKIYSGARGSTDGIYLDRDVYSSTYGPETTSSTIPRVETISIYSGVTSWLDIADVMYFYVDSYWDDEEDEISGYDTVPYQSLTGLTGEYASAFAQVDVMYGNEHYGTWVLPWNSAEDTLQVLRLDYNGTDLIVASAGNADDAYGGIRSISWE